MTTHLKRVLKVVDKKYIRIIIRPWHRRKNILIKYAGKNISTNNAQISLVFHYFATFQWNELTRIFTISYICCKTNSCSEYDILSYPIRQYPYLYNLKFACKINQKNSMQIMLFLFVGTKIYALIFSKWNIQQPCTSI
jgi:hypothetical protein